MAGARDAVIVGGGHNGLVAAAYLARSGLDTLVCERRDVVGGAAVSEHPFGLEYTVTSLSYVVSLLSPGLVRDLGLASFGYHVYPQGPYFAPRADHPDANALAAYADRMIARMETVAPGFTNSVLHRQVIGPHQMQQEYGLIGGNIFHGELSLGQMFHARPAAGYADFRTPVRGLYQAGSATHGGGGVTGIPGRNAVRQILADRRVARWRQRATPRLTTTAQAPPRS